MIRSSLMSWMVLFDHKEDTLNGIISGMGDSRMKALGGCVGS